MKRGLAWVGVLLSMLVLIMLIFVRGMGISAKRQPTAIEEQVAKAVWRFLVPPPSRTLTNPVPTTPDVIRAGLEHWADHCATCHANDGSGETEIGRGLHPPAPSEFYACFPPCVFFAENSQILKSSQSAFWRQDAGGVNSLMKRESLTNRKLPYSSKMLRCTVSNHLSVLMKPLPHVSYFSGTPSF